MSGNKPAHARAEIAAEFMTNALLKARRQGELQLKSPNEIAMAGALICFAALKSTNTADEDIIAGLKDLLRATSVKNREVASEADDR